MKWWQTEKTYYIQNNRFLIASLICYEDMEWAVLIQSSLFKLFWQLLVLIDCLQTVICLLHFRYLYSRIASDSFYRTVSIQSFVSHFAQINNVSFRKKSFILSPFTHSTKSIGFCNFLRGILLSYYVGPPYRNIHKFQA